MGCGRDVNYIISVEPSFVTTVLEIHRFQKNAYFVGEFEGQEAHISLNPEKYNDSYLSFNIGDRVKVYYGDYYEEDSVLYFDNVYFISETSW